LVFATGAGAVSNNGIGLVISCGMLVGTCFTLFILPAFYLIVAGPHYQEPVLHDDVEE
jgi:multidrug efflux pump